MTLVVPCLFPAVLVSFLYHNAMNDTNDLPSPDQLRDLVDAGAVDDAAESLSQLETESADDRKTVVQALRTHAESAPAAVTPLAPALTPFLTDAERSVRLSTTKLFVTLAAADPNAVADTAESLADRLADDEEFYYVRARAAEALGYVAAAQPSVVTPEILADLRIGLTFDEPEVKTKLAKALASVALGNPRRLRHQTDDLAGHLAADDELVCYQLATALVAVGCEHPDALPECVDALTDRLDDDNPYVRGRAAEALGLLARTTADHPPALESTLAPLTDDNESFVVDRVQFAVAGLTETSGTTDAGPIGTTEAIRERTDEIVEAITTPDVDDGCPHCGVAISGSGPPHCPQCGRPY